MIGIKVCQLEGPSGGVEWLAWHSKGHVIAAGDAEGSVWLWNVQVGFDSLSFVLMMNVLSLGWSLYGSVFWSRWTC